MTPMAEHLYLPFLFLILFFQPILFHIIAAEDHCMHHMHGYCVLWKSLLFDLSSTVQLWLSNLVMQAKICQRRHVGLHGFRF